MQEKREKRVRVHELKTWPVPYQAVLDKKKHHEVRRDDRGYGVGDVLVLREYDPTTRGAFHSTLGYTGHALIAHVTYLTSGDQFGIPSDICVMSIVVLQWSENYHPGVFDEMIRVYRQLP